MALSSGNTMAFDNTKSDFFQEGCVLSLITKQIMIPHVKSIRAEHSQITPCCADEELGTVSHR